MAMSMSMFLLTLHLHRVFVYPFKPVTRALNDVSTFNKKRRRKKIKTLN